MQYIYAPGCALMSYKPHLAEKLKQEIQKIYGPVETLLNCCFNSPKLSEEATCIITPCVTCAASYRKLYPTHSVLFFLSKLAESDDFPFPDYGGIEMSIQDTCAARTQPEALSTIRRLLERMNIKLVEPAKSGTRAKCCGQVFYGKLEVTKVESLMKARADEMPCQEVVVYCASCIMSMAVGGKRPRYIIDLLFGEPTEMERPEVTSWNNRLRDFRNAHKK